MNIELLDKVVEWVEDQESLGMDDSHWYQGSWWSRKTRPVENADPYCGSGMCVAGVVAHWAGWVPVFREDYPDVWIADVVTKKGQTRHISALAREELGLNQGQADRLFDGGNGVTRIRNLVEEFTATVNQEGTQ